MGELKSKVKSQKSKVKIFSLLSVVFLAFLLRVYKVDKIPPSLYWDEAAMALDAKAISLTGKDHHGNFWLQAIYPSWGDYKLPGYILTAVPFFKLIENNPELAIRLPSAIAGTLTVLIIYFLTKELFKKSHYSLLITHYLPIIAALLLAISPWHLQFSRAAFEANLALFFNSLALLFFIQNPALTRKHRALRFLWLIFAVLFATLGIYTYYSARIVLPLILFLTFLLFWKKSFKNILSFVLILGFIFLFSLPLKFSSLAPQAEQFRLSTKNILTDSKIIEYSSRLIEQDGNNFVAKKIHHRFLYQAKTLASHYFDHFSLNFLILSGDTNLRHSTRRIGVLLVVSFIGLVFGEYLLFNINKKLFVFLNLCLLFSFLPACVPYETPHALRSLNGVIFLNIIAAFGLVQLIKVLKNKKFLLFVVCCLLFAQVAFYLHDYYSHYSSRSFLAWQGGYKEAIEVVDQEYDKAKKIIFTEAYARPYIYFLLYSNYPLKLFQEQRQEFLSQQPLNYLETTKIDKIEFKKINFKEDKKGEEVLIIGAPEEIPEGVEIGKISTFVLWKNY